MDMNNRELSSEELNQVQGGSFMDRGVFWSSDEPNRLIVTAGNSCTHYSGSCASCPESVRSGLVLYCKYRTHDNDPVTGYKK